VSAKKEQGALALLDASMIPSPTIFRSAVEVAAVIAPGFFCPPKTWTAATYPIVATLSQAFGLVMAR
jgi:hypothetical protein